MRTPEEELARMYFNLTIPKQYYVAKMLGSDISHGVKAVKLFAHANDTKQLARLYQLVKQEHNIVDDLKNPFEGR